ncbi:MAG: enolase C-terminal domain-like protein [Streptosporangiaceae bacterium]
MPRIESFEAFHVAMPRGRRPESVLVKLTCDDGVTGWGETAGHDIAWTDLEERLGPALLGLDWDRPEDLSGIRALAGPGATAAVDMAVWDLWGRAHQVPVWHALGGTRTSVVTGARIPCEPVLDTLLPRVNRYIGGGYARVTLEIRPGFDIEAVRTVRRSFPALALQVDAAGSYTDCAEHLETLEALDAYDVIAIERPFAPGDLVAHAQLQRIVRAAVAPAIDDLDTLEAAITLEAGRALSLRISRLGGLTAARAAHDRGYAAGWEIWCGGAGAFGVGQAAAVALASMPGCSLPSDITEMAGGPEFVSPPVRSTGGVVAVPLTQPGLGHTVDERRIARLATRALDFRP